ncbi:SGNH/GDSL hydrolase family protein [Paenibacillus sp. N1-5-1-14]|uniref:SGNH/GDSL hydrolase family protein n=1 Tax=Paenibacillus radicibacter TaxID=2972488 RepID=UPI002158A4EB|nr:SGNH/GDSL hydrolase family protein [Paenibacillus radicibacter]MCR8643566.1 SGNH/GDSL hydrolase family protein [Paenibacillus radicibacter]
MHIIGFGDSITSGVYLAEEDTYLYKLKQQFGGTTTNAGVPGNNTNQGLARIQTDVISHQPDITIIAFGMNDHYATAVDTHLVDPSTYKSNLTEMVNQLRAHACTPILCTISPIIVGDASQYYYNRHPEAWYQHPLGAQAWIDAYSGIVREVAAELNVVLADIAEHFANALADGETLTGPQGLIRNLDNAGTDDGVHPTAKGNDLYAECIAVQINQILADKC